MAAAPPLLALIVEILAPLALLWLGLLFPERSRIDIRMPWLKWCILALMASGLAVELVLEYAEWYNHTLLANRAQIDAVVGPILRWTVVCCVVVYWIAIFGKLRVATSPDARRRLRVLCSGSVIGLGSMLIIFGALPWFGIADPGNIPWIDFLAAILMLTFPLTLAYVVIVQRAMDLHILLRMGTKYVLARTTLVAIELCVALFVLVYVIFPAVHAAHHSTLDYTISALALAGLIWMFAARGSLSARMQEWLDRKFFREAYQAELILSGLAARVRSITDRPTLIDTVANSISKVLHIEKLAAFLRNGDLFQLEQAVGVPVDQRVSIPLPSVRVSSIAGGASPVVVYRRQDNPMLAQPDDAAQRIFDTLSPEVILPLPGRNKLMGFMALGSKLSEEPYSTSDLRLLESIGGQTGLSLEISELAQSLADEAARRERIQREIEIAREVQERLFPQSIPLVPDVDLAGNCRPAFGVGGDYYDIFRLDDDRVALAIGDVSGKGVSAALLMASLRASLRTIAEDGCRDLGQLMSRLNGQVYEASAANRYATFFFAVFAPSSLELRYVNAGHNAPFVIRNESEPLRLEAGGTVVGLLKDSTYVEGSLQLQPGDVLLAYTDGISEAMTTAGEEWSEQGMIVPVIEAQRLCANEILQRVMNAADKFARGAPQHDDMTLLIMKILPR